MNCFPTETGPTKWSTFVRSFSLNNLLSSTYLQPSNSQGIQVGPKVYQQFLDYFIALYSEKSEREATRLQIHRYTTPRYHTTVSDTTVLQERSRNYDRNDGEMHDYEPGDCQQRGGPCRDTDPGRSSVLLYQNFHLQVCNLMSIVVRSVNYWDGWQKQVRLWRKYGLKEETTVLFSPH